MSQLEQIGSEDAERAYEFCAEHPERSTYVGGWIHDGGLENRLTAPKGWLLAERDQSRRIVGLAYLSGTGILIPVLRSETSFEHILSLARMNPGMIRVLVGDRAQVGALWARLTRLGLRERLSRDQLVYSTTRATFIGVESPLTMQLAADSDLTEVVNASGAMAREEAGDDPQRRNPTLFRERIRTRLTRKRDFVHRDAARLVFKANVSALSPIGGQLEGIYTMPDLRRQRLGLRGTSAMTSWILERSERAVLLVNDDNEPAQALYTRLGYARSHESRTIFVAP